MASVEDAIRELVRAQVEQSGTALTPPPTWRDAAWLVVAMTDLALAIILIPQEALKDSRLELYVKLAPWIATSVFALGAAWFKEAMLALSRSPHLHRGAATLLVLLTAVQLPIVPRTPVASADPATVVRVDGRIVRAGGFGWFSLASHRVEVASNAACASPNTVTIPPLLTAWHAVMPLSVSAMYRVAVSITSEQPITFTVARSDARIPLEVTSVPPTDGVEVTSVEPTEITVQTQKDVIAFELTLPAGTYQFKAVAADGRTCAGGMTSPVNASTCTITVPVNCEAKS